MQIKSTNRFTRMQLAFDTRFLQPFFCFSVVENFFIFFGFRFELFPCSQRSVRPASPVFIFPRARPNLSQFSVLGRVVAPMSLVSLRVMGSLDDYGILSESPW